MFFVSFTSEFIHLQLMFETVLFNKFNTFKLPSTNKRSALLSLFLFTENLFHNHPTSFRCAHILFTGWYATTVLNNQLNLWLPVSGEQTLEPVTPSEATCSFAARFHTSYVCDVPNYLIRSSTLVTRGSCHVSFVSLTSICLAWLFVEV